MSGQGFPVSLITAERNDAEAYNNEYCGQNLRCTKTRIPDIEGIRPKSLDKETRRTVQNEVHGDRNKRQFDSFSHEQKNEENKKRRKGFV